jgi:hypothetical protein
MLKLIIPRNPPNDKFDEYLKPSLDKIVGPDVMYYEIFNNQGLADSIFKKYNIGIEYYKNNGANDNDIVGFMHGDVKIRDENFVKKVQLVFDKRKDVGVLGAIGTRSFHDSGGWWLCDHSYHFGRLIQGVPGTDGKETYEMNRGIGFADDMVAIDGFCFFTTFKIANEIRFDETLQDYHFYDYDFCFSVLEKGYKVAVADILLEHSSEGPMPASWHVNKVKFINKWKQKGYKFPLTVRNFG